MVGDIYGVQGLRVAVGLSTIVSVPGIVYQCAMLIKNMGGGTLEIGGATLTWGNGYRMGDKEAIGWDSRATFYLASSGATCVLDIFRAGTNPDFGT